jgi:hypothetical protein
MPFRHNSGRVLFLCALASLAIFASLSAAPARAQDDDTAPQKHGRKYKAPPDTSHIEVTVIKGFNKKPIMNAAVIFHPVKDGKDEGNLEMKTDPDGKAVIDVIPTGSAVRIQVIADGFATFAEDYQIDQPSRQILDNNGKPADLKPGVQEPIRPKVDAKGNPIVPVPSSGSGSSTGPSSGSSANSGDSSSNSGTKPQP